MPALLRPHALIQPRGLWRYPNFLKLWLGKTISTFGSHISGAAIPLTALLVLHASAAEIGLLTALEALPILLMGLAVGVWVDRLPLQRLLIWADLGRAALLLSIPVAFALHRLAMTPLYLVAFLVGALTLVSEVGSQAFLPRVIHPEQLLEGNSKLGMSDSVAEIGGPSLGGVLIQWISAPFAIIVDAVSFLISAASLRWISAPDPATHRVPGEVDEMVGPERRETVVRAARDGLRFVWRQPMLRALALSIGTFTFFGYFIGTLYTLYAIRTLRLSPAAVGTLIGLGGVSALVGALLAERIVSRFGFGRTLIGSLMCYGALGALIPLAGGPPQIAYICMALPQLLGDAFIAVHFIAQTSLRQALIPAAMRGRASASMQTIERGVGPAGALVAGVLATVTSPRVTLALGALGVALAACWMIFSPLRGLRGLPSQPLSLDFTDEEAHNQIENPEASH
jgi:predicted MFS family arabinose efflux permease